MAFDHLKPRPPMHFPAAAAYAESVLARSREAAARADVRFTPDVPYGPHEAQRVDVYAPAIGGLPPLPVLVFVHGGAWSGGYKEWMGFMAPAVLATPAVFVSVEYRLAPEHAYPAAVQDVAAAVKWAMTDIAAFGGDSRQLFLGGHSAGGHLAALVAVDPSWLNDAGVDTGAVKGVLAISGVYDLCYEDRSLRNDTSIAIRRGFLRDDADAPAASPINHVSPRAPAFYVAAGEHEVGSIAEDARRLAEALRRLGVPAALDIFEAHDHFDANSRCVDDGHPWISRARPFLLTGSPD
ncbi:alpha/beta hydrolase [Cupriavidus taiwanensis]|uniref:alpha/beta hydrolase n=1 Tax=Cupriavidus taiwanensis TaxID=164546 RepID=UPI0039C3A8A3